MVKLNKFLLSNGLINNLLSLSNQLSAFFGVTRILYNYILNVSRRSRNAANWCFAYLHWKVVINVAFNSEL
jgi:hypothetical protein